MRYALWAPGECVCGGSLRGRGPCISANQLRYEDVDTIDSESHVIITETYSMLSHSSHFTCFIFKNVLVPSSLFSATFA